MINFYIGFVNCKPGTKTNLENVIGIEFYLKSMQINTFNIQILFLISFKNTLIMLKIKLELIM